MPDSFYVGAYWHARQETLESCARRATCFLRGMSFIDSHFVRWFKLGMSRRQALQHEIDITESSIRFLFKEVAKHRERDKHPAGELGFSLGLWNGDTDAQAIGLHVTCGCYSRYVSNAVVLTLPRRGDAADEVLNVLLLERIVAALCDCWDPDWVTVTSGRLRDEVLKLPERAPKVGWLTYLSRKYGRIPHIEGVEVKPTTNGGTLIIATHEKFSTDRPDHVKLAARIAEVVLRLQEQM